MSRRSRAGTAEKPPSVEETLGRLEVKLKELELKYELKEKAESQFKNELTENLDLLKSDVEKLQIQMEGNSKQILNLNSQNEFNKNGHEKVIERMDTEIQEISEKISRVSCDLERVQEKMYDFDANKKGPIKYSA